MPALETEVTPNAEVTVTPEMTKAIDSAVSSEDIKAIFLEEVAKQKFPLPRDEQGRFTEKKEEPEVDAAKTDDENEDDKTIVYSDDLVIGGKKYHFEGDSPGDINRQVKAAIAAHEHATNPPKPETVKKGLTAEEKVSLQLDMQLGRITPEEYLEKTGFVDSYLEKKGIKVGELQEVIQEKKSKSEVSAWEAATDEFLKLPGQDWPGGDNNLKIVGYKLAELGLTNSPSAASLTKAYEAMKAEGIVFRGEPKPEAQASQAQPAPKKKFSGSSVFGVGGGDAKKDKGVDPNPTLPKITDDMSPREIMEAFKASAAAQGVHPDELIRQSQR
jgi:hypothetical protein